jgi:sugar/nucleoside kinase (ribokinase family)
MTFAGNAEVVGYGAGALDFYMPVGEVGEDHIPGAKVGWTEEDQLRLEAALPDDSIERHVGGNVVNALAWIACKGGIRGDVALATVVGVGDPATMAINRHLPEVNIQNLAKREPSYLPSVSLIERAAAGSDRMVRGRPRTRMDGYMDEEYIAQTSENANLVLVASLKSAALAGKVFEHTPRDAFVSYNPGSSEFVSHPGQLFAVMRQRNPNLTSLNDDELRQMFGKGEDARIEPLIDAVTQFSESVLCTMGAKGIILARRLKDGRVEQMLREVTPLPAEEVEDNLGAGDRANAITTHGLYMGWGTRLILEQVVKGTASVIKRTGAHGDLYANAS